MARTRLFTARAFGLWLCFLSGWLSAGETYFVRTNYSDRTITNYVEVQMPRNVFVNQFHTNYVQQFRTNVVQTWSTNHYYRDVTNNIAVTRYYTNVFDRFHTNWHQAFRTNDFAVHLTHTNWFEAFHTNWHHVFRTNDVAVNLTRTNWVDLYHTNWHAAFLTNDLAVNLTRTNFVERYLTNLETINLTNWQTVLVMKTNWIAQPVTNVVQIDLPAEPARTLSASPAHAEQVASPTVTSASTAPGDEPIIQAARTIKPAANNQAEVVLEIKWPADFADPLAIQQWRLERQGGSFLSFSQEQVLKRELPPGTYNVEARLRRAADGASMVLHGTLQMSLQEAFVQQKPAAKKLFSSVQ